MTLLPMRMIDKMSTEDIDHKPCRQEPLTIEELRELIVECFSCG